MEATSLTHMEKIRKGTWDIHEGMAPTGGRPKEEKPASTGPDIMKGTLPKEAYIRNLGQRYLIQGAIEDLLRAHRGNEFVGRVVTDEQFHADKAAADLRFFGVDPATVKPLASTTTMIRFFKESAARDPRLVLAMHYVIEGSNNGATYIARAVQKAFGLEGTDGVYHLLPYGPAIRDKWKAFGEAFNSLDIDDALMGEMVKVLRATYGHMNKVADEAHAESAHG